uniref:Uncharacterized protein n=2 Tax=Oryza sativa subsp. japonica TaxID=39947 RepID=Q75J43_ORYSJ|nr:hypothetical protein [Oryza sativa Japonica Group]ABF97799.1 hypothetical protein LOC_Os03g43710 [Oryza sativa Japonica Group]
MAQSQTRHGGGDDGDAPVQLGKAAQLVGNYGAVEVCDDGDHPVPMGSIKHCAPTPLDWADDAADVGGDGYGPSGGEADSDLAAGDDDKLGAGPPGWRPQRHDGTRHPHSADEEGRR